MAASSNLQPGALGEISFDVTFDPAELTHFLNSATATGTNTAGTVTDTSDDGAEPDTDGDGNADEPGENDPTPIGLGGPIVESPGAGRPRPRPARRAAHRRRLRPAAARR